VMESLATAVLSLFELQRRVGRLVGITHRVGVLLSNLRQREPVLEDKIALHTEQGNAPSFDKGESIKFDNVCIYKPDGVLLCKDLTFEIRGGCEKPQRVMVTGDNGCGKSSMFRVLCGLWPLCSGTITKPPDEKIYFLSQVNFVPIGSLREVIIYPKKVAEWEAECDQANMTKEERDATLHEVLEWANLKGFKCANKHPELDDILEWDTALSPGQKQRIAFARLFHHRPQFAVLDECTNGIAPAVETDLFNRCHTLKMGVFSISHKEALKKVHDYELHFNADKEGSYEWIDLSKVIPFEELDADGDGTVSRDEYNAWRERQHDTSPRGANA